MIVKITCVQPALFISEAAQNSISMENLKQVDDFTIYVEIASDQCARLMKLGTNRGAEISIVNQNDFRYRLTKILARPVLTAGMILMLFLSIYLPTRILFYQVEGNTNVSSRDIIACLEKNGIVFGSCRKAIRSEQIKNILISEIPQLQWVGVNTYGCTARILVKEKSVPVKLDDMYGVSSIISSVDGVICDMTITKGSPVCAVGQAVKKGQKLISGYTDCGLSVRAENAEGEVYGLTIHDYVAVAPLKQEKRGAAEYIRTVYSIILGKKLINLNKDSSNLDAKCAKIYLVYYLTLPGGFQLPFGIVKETQTVYAMNVKDAEHIQLTWLPVYAENYVYAHMLQGKILSRKYDYVEQSEAIEITCRFFCKEMIGCKQREEIIQ